MKTLYVRGKVASGKGEGAKFIQLPWVRKQIIEKLGFIPYPGTLNVILSEDRVKFKKLLKKTKSTEISPANGFCHGRCFEAYLMGNYKCVIVFPEIPNYPEDIIEIIAPTNLREILDLKDGDAITVRIVL